MTKEEIKKLRELPIEGVAERLGLTVTHHKSLCPFHDDHHASLSYKESKNVCQCFVCMDHAIGPIDLVMRHLHVDFPKACHWLADENNIILEKWKPSEFRSPHPTINQPKPFDASRYARFFEHPWLSDEARKFLFEERLLDERVIRWCRLSSWQDREGTHWLQIPYFDSGGRLIGLQNRNLDYGKKRSHTDLTDLTDFSKGGMENTLNTNSSNATVTPNLPNKSNLTNNSNLPKASDKKEKPRFRFPYGAKCGVYNLPVLQRLKEGDHLYITEGCSDCWAMLSAGHKAIAIPSATLLLPEDKELLVSVGSRLGIQWHMYPDRDAPGERLFLQLKELLPSIEHHQLPAGCKDFGEAFVKGKKVKE